MGFLSVIVSLLLIWFVLLEAFETLVLPRRIERRFRATRVFYRTLWGLWTRIANAVKPEARDNFLAFFGPLSLLLLFAAWAVSLIACFGLLEWGLHMTIHPAGTNDFASYLYLSATTFVTLGYG